MREVFILRRVDSENNEIVSVHSSFNGAHAAAHDNRRDAGGQWTTDAERVPEYWDSSDDGEDTLIITRHTVEPG